MKSVAILLLVASSMCFSGQDVPRSGCRDAMQVTIGDETKTIKEWEELYPSYCFYADPVKKKLIKIENEDDREAEKRRHRHGSRADVTRGYLFYRCRTCGMVFKLNRRAMDHADETGHRYFDPVRY